MTDSQPFRAEADRSGSHLTIYCEGEIDALSSPTLLDAFSGRNKPPAKVVWVDLSAVSFIDSSGLVAIQRLHQGATDGGGLFKLVDPSPAVERILKLTGLDDVIPTYRKQATDA